MIRRLFAKLARLARPIKRNGVDRLAAAYTDQMIQRFEETGGNY